MAGNFRIYLLDILSALLMTIIMFGIKGQPWMAITAFFPVFFSMMRYFTKRSKAIETAYPYVIAASDRRFRPLQSAALHRRLAEQRVPVRETGGWSTFFRKLRAMAGSIFRKAAATPGFARTKEIRWFFSLPDAAIESFFSSFGKSLSETVPRTDHYLSIQGKDDINMKLREGKMEIKKRTGIPLPWRFSAHSAGFLEEWEKYTFFLQEGKILLDEHEHWLAVKKERIGLKFAKNKQGEWTSSDIKERTAAGWQVEYTRLTIHGRVSYTFGLEWFGSSRQEPLPPVLNGLLETLRLDADASFGYNAYLNRVVIPGNSTPGNS